MPAIKNHFVAVTQDGYSADGHLVPAVDVIKARLETETWPLYANTKNRKVISKGDCVVFYVGGMGPNGGHTVAVAEVVSRDDAGRRTLREEYATSPLSSILRLKRVKFFSAIPLKPVLIQCGIIREENKKWGAFLMGGLCRVPETVANKLSGNEQ